MRLPRIPNPASVQGLPRPRVDGRPLPWITEFVDGVPAWKRIDPTRLLLCQAEWRCQVCGQSLPDRAWVIVQHDGWILGDAAMHQPCPTITRRWCPFLADLDRVATEVERDQVDADGHNLANLGEYGDQERKWTLRPDPPSDS